MKKRFFQPIWKFEEIENQLKVLEENGWRLNRIKGFRCFEFVESKPKQVQYFFTYSMVKETSNMYPIENALAQKFNATQIKGNFFEGLGITSIFRITKTEQLNEQKLNRDIILHHYLFKKFIFGIVILLLLFLPLLIGAILNLEKLLNDMNPFYYVFFSVVIILSVVYSIYNFIGFIYMKKKLTKK